jgi:hypothetical protein
MTALAGQRCSQFLLDCVSSLTSCSRSGAHRYLIYRLWSRSRICGLIIVVGRFYNSYLPRLFERLWPGAPRWRNPSNTWPSCTLQRRRKRQSWRPIWGNSLPILKGVLAEPTPGMAVPVAIAPQSSDSGPAPCPTCSSWSGIYLFQPQVVVLRVLNLLPGTLGDAAEDAPRTPHRYHRIIRIEYWQVNRYSAFRGETDEI